MRCRTLIAILDQLRPLVPSTRALQDVNFNDRRLDHRWHHSQLKNDKNADLEIEKDIQRHDKSNGANAALIERGNPHGIFTDSAEWLGME